MKKRLLSLLFVMLAIIMPIRLWAEDTNATVRSWDFTNWSASTVANLQAEAAKGVSNGTWSDIEKVNDTIPTDLSKNNCFWEVSVSTTGYVSLANGEEIAELAGLQYINSKSRSLAIAVNYQSANATDTNFGPYHGKSYLWLGSSKINYFIIPRVAPGTRIKMGVESHKLTEARGVELSVTSGGTQLLAPDGSVVDVPTTYQDQEWLVPTSLSDTPNDDGTYDIQIYNTNGCHIYYITLLDPHTPTFTRSENMLTIATTMENATIYYTLDGSTPTTESNVYQGPITLTQNCTVKAIAVAEGSDNSPVGTYVVDWFGTTEGALVYPNLSEMGLSTSSTIYLSGGTPIGSNSSMDVAIACPDDYYAIGVLRDDMFYYPYYYFNGEKVSKDIGIWGQTNPKDSENKSPGQSLKVPVTGTAFSMKAKKDGYMYVWGVFSTSKYYSLFEDSVAVGYRLAMITNGWYREGDTSTLGHGRVDIQFGQYHQAFEQAIPNISDAITNDTTNTVNVYGEGVMVFPVKANSTYIMNGNGCKFIFGGVHFNENQESLIQLGNETSPEYTLLKSGDEPLYVYHEKPLCPSPVFEINKELSQLTISCTLNEATIYYTTDGSIPTTNSAKYSAPLVFSENCVVKSIAVAEGYAASILSVYTVNWFSSPDDESRLYEVTFNGQDVEYHDGQKVDIPTFFTFSNGDSKHNFNSKFTGTYNEIEFSKGLKMEGTTMVAFTSKAISKVTIVQSTWSDYTIKFDDIELDVTNTQVAENYRIYTIDSLSTGYHVITRGSGESGLLYVSVEYSKCPIPTFVSEENVLSINCSYPIATVYYTVDGSIPSINSVKYTTPIVLSENCIVKAMAVADGLANSDISTYNVDWFAASVEPEPYVVLTDSNTVMTFYYDGQKEARSATGVTLDLDAAGNPWYDYRQEVTSVVFDATFGAYRPQSTNHWFDEFTNMNTIVGMQNLNTSEVTDMGWMFRLCQSVKSIDVSGWNTENVTDMGGLFYGCQSLESVDVSGFNTAKVVNMENMFGNCYALTSVDVSNFNTSNVTNMDYMFGCTAIKNLDLTSFNTENVTNLRWMFSGYGVNSVLETIDLSTFTTDQVTNMEGMFAFNPQLSTVYVGSGWTTGAVTLGDSTFEGCTSLVGGMGTVYDTNHIDYTYAHVDGGTANPGYFTDKNADALEIYAVEQNGTITPNQPITATQSIVLTPGNDTAWETKYTIAIDHDSEDNTVEFVSSVYYPTNSASYTFTGSMYGTNNPRDGELVNGVSTGSSYVAQKMNLPQSGGYVIFEPQQDGSLIVPVHIGSSKQFYIVDGTGKPVTDMQIKNAAGQTLSLLESPLCALSADNSTTAFASLNVKKGEKYYMFCVGSKMRFGGYVFSTQSITVDPATMANVKQILESTAIPEPEPYVVLTDSNTVVTFYYDDQKTAHGGMDINNSGLGNSPSPYGTVLSAVFDASFANYYPTSTAYWFENCSALKSISGIENLKTDNVTNMSEMFHGCSGLTSLDVSGFNTANVTSMSSMFEGCSGLSSLDVSGFNTANVTNMTHMFMACSGLEGLDLSNFDTSNVTEMYGMFLSNESLKSLNVSSFNTSKVVGMNQMFCGLGNLTNLNVNNFDTSNVKWMYAMFAGCINLTSLDLSSFNSGLVSNMGELFSNCEKLKTIYVGDGWTTTGVGENGNGLFNNCTNLIGGAGTVYDPDHTDYTYAHIDGGTANPGYFTDKNAAPYVNPEPYVVLTDSNTVMTFYYDEKKANRNGMDVGTFEYLESVAWKDYRESISSVVFDSTFVNCTSLSSVANWFAYCSNLTTITGLEYLKTDNVTDMNHMFYRCSSLTGLELSGFNTEKITNMNSLFEGCSGLTSLDLSAFNTANVTNMSWMFEGCSSLTSLDVSGFNTANVTDMRHMFWGCSGLTSLDVTGFSTANVTDMGSMFTGCSGLTSLNVSGFNTANVTDMSYMFYNCFGLTNLDVSSFNTANVKSMSYMFSDCSGLTAIYVGEGWSTAAVTDGTGMFNGCTALVGGRGTAYDANHTDHTYAHIDGGMANPGYFTAKGGLADPLLAPLYDNLALTTTDGNADGGNNDLSGSIDAAQTSLVRAMWNLQELPTDESYCVWMDPGIPALNTNTWSDSTQTQSMMGLYARLYHGIALANNYLANQNDGDMGKQAEARFLRALQYYYLMDHFGNVPLLTDTIDRQPLPVWEATPSDIELLTREEMFSYIENELQESLNSLPATNSYGRATATAARLLLARLYLNSEVYTGTARWQEARSYAESVINGGTFQLAPIYRNLFMGDNDSNGAQQEIILPAIYDGNTRTDYGGTTFLVASSFTNGEGDNGTTQVWAGNVSKPDFVNKFFTQTADIPYASPEQTASAASDDRALFYGINHSYELTNGDSFSDGFPYQKFTNVRSNGTSPVSSKFADTDFPLMRLGEAYLIAAEADARLNGSATSMQGTQYINMLRNRANATTSTAGYSLSDICDEWSREMGYEAVRRTTLIRFGRFGGQTDYSWAWKGGSYDGTAFDAGMNTYPIPAVEVGSTPEPYAVLSADSLTVTFYYDGQKATRVGIDINNSNLGDSPSPYGTATSAVFDASFANYYPTNTAYWFQNCSALTFISGVENLKTDNVTNMYGMFHNCSGLTSLDLSSFNTANVTSMSFMFSGCSGLTSLDVSGFNTANVTEINNMFWGCSGLTSLDVSSFNTTNVTYMLGMFAGCSGLTSLDLSGFNTTNVTDMYGMFSNCSGLTGLDLSSFNTANVTDMTYMFIGCSGLKMIYVGNDWNTASVTESNEMFLECTNLVGGKGTVYDPDHVDASYAHVDGGTANPGYFTLSGDSPYVPVDVTFDNNGVLTVGGTTTMAEALAAVGGANVVAETITAIVWNSTAALTNSDLQNLHNPNMLIYVEVDTLAPVNRDNVIVGDLAKNIVLTDVSDGNGNFYCPMEFKAEMITYTHDYNQTTEVGVARGWETIALPFDVQTIMHDKQGLIAPFGNSTSGKHFWLRQPTENGLASATIIEANTAYLISMPNSDAYSAEFNLNGHVTFSSQNVWVPKTMINGVDFHTKDNTLVVLLPNFQRQASDDMIYALNVGEQRGNYPEGSVFEREYRAVRPFEAYTIHMGGPAPQFISFFDMNGGMTGIESLTPVRSEDEGAWYDLNGRKLQTKPTQKGVYILNGRKAVVK